MDRCRTRCCPRRIRRAEVERPRGLDLHLDDNIVFLEMHRHGFGDVGALDKLSAMGRFDRNVCTGKAVCDPVEIDLRTYSVRVVEGRIEVLLPL